MQEAHTNLVHPILEYGLRLRDRLESGASLHLEREQTMLQDMLRATDLAPADRPDPAFLGIPYALTCWLDELFIQYSPAANAWAQQPLETARYGGSDRHWRFWEQAQLAETRPDDLEVFHLCVLLGFRGNWAEHPEQLRDWLIAMGARLALYQNAAWQQPAELVPPTYVPPLHGREKMRHLIFAGGLTLLGIVPLVAYFAARYLG